MVIYSKSGTKLLGKQHLVSDPTTSRTNFDTVLGQSNNTAATKATHDVS